jgi:hypothetical protein
LATFLFSRRSLCVCAALAVSAALGAGMPAADKAPAHRTLPKGFRSVRSGSGEVLVARVKDVKGAAAVLNRELASLSAYFDARPRVLGGVGDSNGWQAQALFEAKKSGRRVVGLALVHLGARDGLVALYYDEPNKLDRSRKPLADLLARELPQTPDARPMLLAQRLPDGSGVIRVPRGWRVTASNSMVDVKGPDGQILSLGLWGEVWSPAYAAGWSRLTGLPTPRAIPVAAYQPPARALESVCRRHIALLGGTSKVRKLSEVPAPCLRGKAAFVHLEVEARVRGKTVTTQVVGYMNTWEIGDGRWVGYTSLVSTESARFATELPVLLDIWRSWKTDDAVFLKRLRSAMESMKETGRIIEDVLAARKRVAARSCDDWTEVIRGTQIVRDERTTRLHEVPSVHLKKLLERMNRAEGGTRWRIIPLKDLNNP